MKVVVTRHAALIEYLVEKGIVPADTEVISHATIDNVKGNDVIGVLPNHLAAEANSITEVPINIPQELRGKELTLEDLRLYAGEPTTYVVRRV